MRGCARGAIGVSSCVSSLRSARWRIQERKLGYHLSRPTSRSRAVHSTVLSLVDSTKRVRSHSQLTQVGRGCPIPNERGRQRAAGERGRPRDRDRPAGARGIRKRRGWSQQLTYVRALSYELGCMRSRICRIRRPRADDGAACFVRQFIDYEMRAPSAAAPPSAAPIAR